MASIALVNTALLAVLLAVPFLFDMFFAYQIGLYLIYGIAAQGIGYLWGRAGILPLGQAMFFGLSAYACAIILLHVDGLGLQILLLLCVLISAGLLALVIASLIFKGRADSGPFFSLITLALVMICEQVAGTATGVTGGFNGLSGFGTIAGLDQFGGFYYVIVLAVVLSTVALMVLDRLPAGLVSRAVADNEQRLQLLGFRTHIVKGAAFALAAVLAGLAGILFANHQGIVTPTSTGFLLSANLVIWTAVGGRYHVLGPLLGAVLIGYLSSELRDSFLYWEVLLACLFILVVLKAPGGLADLVSASLSRFLPAKTAIVRQSDNVPPTGFDGGAKAVRFDGVRVRAGRVRILNGVDYTTPDKGIVCIIGPNGAGKTSLLNSITGGLPVSGGSISLRGETIANRPPHMALRSGIGRKLQVPSVFQSLTVSENLSLAMLAGRAAPGDFFLPSALGWGSGQLDEMLSTRGFPLAETLDDPASALAQGHRQFLELAMTIAAEPPVLLLDEPCAGLSPDETHLMTRLVKRFQEQNDGLILLIEHDMSIVKSLSNQVMVLHQGEVLAQGTYEEISANPAVQNVYSGGTK
ncbi:ABC transporter permease subunit [Hoeflea prorocentri]|uniref:ATP-binding cassette domain-containing protein n=1 Tax=Hoeflea prorocentri TaxID=1922333 RepID=A0A9X3ZK34_9HYPH|nr:ATP-binding cassette domain-containing protein [Hoeflea prorocentri]MCY6383596.1 ATP-binding cassette domain-containing protein [Hoeflea prorocentri]MDA5401396.1 ATP-binding cassette domain-containing protein [Hoeflea prorocentri]